MTQTILIAEEDDATRRFLADSLTADGYEVLVAASGRHAATLLPRRPDLLLVDVNDDTLPLVDSIRSGDLPDGWIDTGTPVIVTTSHADEQERIRVLERGGDDVIAKPFSYPELRARIGAMLRLAERHRSSGILRAGPLRIDMGTREVTAAGHALELSIKEYDLLLTLANEPTRVCRRRELMDTVWGYDPCGTSRTLDSHVSRLRRKLRAACDVKLVINVHGVGYRLMDAADGR